MWHVACDGATFKVHHEVHSAHEILLDWEIAVSHLLSNQVTADSLDFRFRSLNVHLASFCYKAQLSNNEMRNLMTTNDLRQFPSPTGSRELNAPHGGL